MISICIPIFNYNVTETVRGLLTEAQARDIEVEVVLFDDHSLPAFEEMNRGLREVEGVSYLPLIENIGRSRIRNRIADRARGEWLLFLDCDMVPADGAFLQRYDEWTSGEADIICGGVYYGKRPEDRRLLLRWRADMRKNEERKRRLQHDAMVPISTGNFMIRRELYQKIRFSESLTGYGQEDNLFTLEVRRSESRVVWIENPTEHLGYEPNAEYVRKVEQSLLNIARLWNAYPSFRPDIRRSSLRVRAVYWLRRLRLARGFRLALAPFMRGLRRRVVKGNSRLCYFNLYQLVCLLYAFRVPNLHRSRFLQAWRGVQA